MPPSSACGWYRAVPSSVPPSGSTLRMCWRVSGRTSPSTTPCQPLRKPMIEWPCSPSPRLTTARIAAFRPGDVAAAGEQSDSHAGTPSIAGPCSGTGARRRAAVRDAAWWPRSPDRLQTDDTGPSPDTTDRAGRAAGWPRPGTATCPDDGGGRARWWDANADEYLAEHGDVPRAGRLLLVPRGPARGGRAPARRRRRRDGCSRSAPAPRSARGGSSAQGVAVGRDRRVGRDARRRAPRYDAAAGRAHARWSRPTPGALPFADASFDVAFTAFGALPVRARRRPGARRGRARAAARAAGGCSP